MGILNHLKRLEAQVKLLHKKHNAYRRGSKTSKALAGRGMEIASKGLGDFTRGYTPKGLICQNKE